MKKALIYCTLLGAFGIQQFASADFEFLYIIKEREYRQVGNVAPTTPVGWVFGAGVEGDSQVTGTTMTIPGSVTPVNLPGEDGEYDIDIQDIANQGLLDADYPNGDYSLSITDNGSTQNYGPFSITGDAYPIIPHLLNPMALHSHDLSQDFTLIWAPFTGADASDTAIVQVFNTSTDEDVFFEFVDTSATSVVIPGGSFATNGTYEIGVLFVNETSELQNVDTIVGYTSSNYFDINLSPQNFEDPDVLISRGILANQSSSTIPTTGDYSFLVEAEGATFSSVTLVKPDTSEVNVPNEGFGEFFVEENFGTEGERDIAYPEGNYTLKVVSNAQEIELSPIAQSGATTPVIPGVTNWDAAQAIDPNLDFNLSWNAFSNAGDEAFIEISIWNVGDQNNELEFELASDAQGLLLSSNFLQPNSTYQGEIIFINPAIFPQTIDGILVNSYYEVFTNFTLQTTDGSGGGGGPDGIDFIYTVKEAAYDQVGNTVSSQPVEWNFAAGVSGGDLITAATITYPGSGGPVNLENGEGDFETDDQDFASQAALDAAFPNGQVTLNVTVDGVPQELGPFNITGNVYPAAPTILNAGDLSSLDLSQDFNVMWSPFSSADSEDRIRFVLENTNGGDPVIETFLDASDTSYLIPGGTLQSNQTYEIILVFINETDGLETPDTIIGYISNTRFEFSTFQTSEDPSTVLFYKRAHYDQTGPTSLSDPDYLGFAFVNGNSNNVTSAMLDSPTSTDPNLFNFFGVQFLYSFTFDSLELLDVNYPAGDYFFNLNENGSPVTYGPYPFTDAAFPTAPTFTNYNDLSNFDATQSQLIDWSVVPGNVTGLVVEIRDGSNNIVWREEHNAPLPTSATVAGGILQNGQAYSLALRFWENQYDGIPNVGLGYLTQTLMTIETSIDGGGGGNGNPPGVDFIYIIKERAFDQVANFNPEGTDAEWGFGAGVSGGDNITGATVTYPGSGGPQNLPGQPGDYELDNEEDFDSQAALDAAYPNGQVSFSVTEDGLTSNLGPFNISGDNYPNVPHVLNAAALGSFDFSQPFLVQWNEFVGGNADDRIVFQLWRNDDDEELIFEFLDSNITSFEIPANTLEPNRTYDLDIIFVKETDGLDTPDTIIGYLSTTGIDISTYPDFNASPDLDIFLSKGTFGAQNTEQDPGVQQWFFFAEAEVNGITAMTINLPDGGNFPIPPSPDYPNLFEYEQIFPTQAELNGAFPDGIYNITVTVNGIETIYGPYTLGGGIVPNQPYFTNWADFQTVDPSSSFTVAWSPFVNPPQDALLELEIQSAPGYGDLDIDFDSSDPNITSVEIPANTLEPNSKYIMTGFFLSPSTTGSDPEVFLGYETFVQTTFWTGEPTVGPSPASDLTAQILNADNVFLNWTDNSNDEIGFRIERKALWEEDWSILANTGMNTSSYLDNTVALGEAYNYRVVVFDSLNDGARSNEVEVQMQPPSDPTGLNVDPYNSTTLTVSWTDNSEGESGFDIERSTDGNNWSNVGNTGPNENVFIDTGLESGSTFVYRVRALSGLGSSEESNTGSDTTYEATTGKPINISTRGTIGSGDDFIMIAGFVINGNENKDIYIRGIAPSLPITGETVLLQDPELVLFDGSKNQIDFNDNWRDHARVADTIATTIPPPLDEEAAIFVNLAPGVYTVQMRGADGGTGAGLVEVYEANPDNDAQLVNISTRGIAGTGDGLMIAGVIVKGTGNRTLYIRGNGPSLPASLEGRLTDTTLVMRNAAKEIVAESDNWMDNPNFASIIATTIPPGFPEEAAILVNVPASAAGETYTIGLRGAGDEEGWAIIGVFEVPD